jgi:hypothetical protein
MKIHKNNQSHTMTKAMTYVSSHIYWMRSNRS